MTAAHPSHPSRYAGISLREDEKILVDGIVSTGIFWKAFAVAMLAVCVGLMAWQLGVFLLIVSFLMFVVAALTKRFLLLALTDYRVLVRYGIMNLETLQIRFDSLESAEVHKTLVGQFLGYGNVVLTGKGTRRIIIPFIDNAEFLRDRLDEILYEREKGARKL